MAAMFYGQTPAVLLPPNPSAHRVKSLQYATFGDVCHFVIEFHVTKTLKEVRDLLGVASLFKCSITHPGYNKVVQSPNRIEHSWPISMDSIECHPKFKKLKVELRNLKRDYRELEKELAEAVRENGILEATTDHACAKHIMLINEKKNLTKENKLLVSDNNFLEDEIAMLKADNARLAAECDRLAKI